MADTAAGAGRKALTFEKAWPILQVEGIDKLIHSLEHEGPRDSQIFTSHDYMRLYTLVYEVCQPNPLGPDTRKLYDQYEKTFQDYISSKVLPSLRGKENQDLLKELLKQWTNHRILSRWLSRFFYYLERYFIQNVGLPSLKGTSHLAFYKLIYGEINCQITDAILSLIDKEREGGQIDQTFVKEVLDIYVEIGEDSLKYYEKDFEEAMVNATAEFYSKKSLDWISTMSYENYMLKVEECLKQEESRATSYLRYRTRHKLFEVVKRELLIVHASTLEEKKHLDEAQLLNLITDIFIFKHQDHALVVADCG